MAPFSPYYPFVYTQLAQQGEIEMNQQRRKRKKTKGEGSIRKLTKEQANYLEENFRKDPRLVSERKDTICLELGLNPRRVAIWFQNRRARWKTKKVEEDYSPLKSKHASIVVEKCRLENEALKLKQQLNDAEKEIKRLMELSERTWRTSSSLSLSMEPPFEFGEFGKEGLEEVLFLAENNNTMDMLHSLVPNK